MSDLLATTGWVGEHPVDGSDVAHLLAYPATGVDDYRAAKVALMADVWEMHDTATGIVEDSPVLTVDLGRATLRAPGLALPLPPLSAAWLDAARTHGFVVVSLTCLPLSAPTLAVIDGMLADLRDGEMWMALSRLG